MSANRSQSNDRFEGYVPVHVRIGQFYSDYPAGRILTAIVEHDEATGFVLMRAEVYRNSEDQLPSATGHAFEVRGEGYVNKTSHIENCETGAVGRALANLGYEVKEQPKRAEPRQASPREPSRPQAVPPKDTPGALINQIFTVAEECGVKRKDLDKTAKDDYQRDRLEDCSEDEKKAILSRLLAARADIELRADIQSYADQTDQTQILYDYLETNYKVKKLSELRGEKLAEVMAWLKGDGK